MTERWERWKRWSYVCTMGRGRTGDIMVVTDEREARGHAISSLPSRVSRMVYNSLECIQTQTQSPNLPPSLE